MSFVIGQRWASHSEQSLGLGVVTEVGLRRITINFPAVAETRTYAIDTAPISRIRYRENDRVQDMDETRYMVQSTDEQDGLITYHCLDSQGKMLDLHELELNCFAQFTTPVQRLFSGQFSRLKTYQLRIETLAHHQRLQRSTVRGLLGARTNLLPHQLYIANEVASRHKPRVLLADEVGLGKTIEAGLIMHHQVLRAQAARILILVPESLIHQWLVEMLRRFNLTFSIFDNSRIQALLESGDENPFESEQRVLCNLDEVCANPDIQTQAAAQHWDMLIIDEAHHLHWSSDNSSREYDCVEKLAGVSDSLLLLTATPEHLGIDSHYARLRLLDPARFHDLDAFRCEQAGFETINSLVSRIQDNDSPLPAPVHKQLAVLVGEELASTADHPGIIRALLDRHGTGRVLFRNTRKTVSGFAHRQLHPTALPQPELYADTCTESCFPEQAHKESQWIKADPRVAWLEALAKSLRPNKILAICHHAATAMALEKHFNLRAGIRSTSFHEGLSIIERDRAAAWFADDDNGAQIMLCSEIGSEGRNFQFAHHLVLFDLPLDPDLLEQRIGRLDRIGQRQSIQIHLPYLQNSAQEVLFHWYHEGLDIFQHCCPVGYTLYEKFKARLEQQLYTPTPALADLITDTRTSSRELQTQLEQGRDRLLELNSCDSDKAHLLIEHIEQEEHSQHLRQYMQKVFEHYGVDYEDISEHTQTVRPSDHMRTEHFPCLRPEGMGITYDRANALVREDLEFMSWEHPMVSEVMEMIHKSDTGNATVAGMHLKTLKPGTLLLEASFTIECVAPAELQLHRHLPAHPTRVLFDARGNDYTTVITPATLDRLCQPIAQKIAQTLVGKVRHHIENMLIQAQAAANASLPQLRTEAIKSVHQQLSTELERLQALAKVNPGIRAGEIDFLQNNLASCEALINRAEFQIQALRLIIAT